MVKKEKKKVTKKPVKKETKAKPKKEKKMVFDVEGDNDDLGGEISIDLDEEPKTPSKNVLKKVVKQEDDESDEEETKIDLEDIKYLKVKGSKPVGQLKKGDKMKVDGLL